MSTALKWTSILMLALAMGGASLAGEEEIIGYVGDKAITRAEVADRVADKLLPLRQQEYDIFSTGFEIIVNEVLVEKEAARRDLTPDELMLAEVSKKVQGPSTEAVDQFYEGNKARMGGKTLDEMRPDIEKYLRQMELTQLQGRFLAGLRAGAGVRIVLDPPRAVVAIPDDVPTLGPEDAEIVIVEFSDFQCPYCRRVHPTVERILEEYGDSIRFVYRDYPLPNHPRASPAAYAARCAGEQDRYWEYHADLMTGVGNLSDEDLEARAVALELDMEAFRSCVQSGRHEEAVQAGLRDGAAAGVSGTPAFFINGRHLSGALPYETFKKILDEEIARSAEAPESPSR